MQIKAAGGPGGNASGATASNVAVAPGGGAGAYAESRLSTLPDTASVVVGAGGNPGNPGGNSSFGSIVANGGGPGGNFLSSTWVSGVSGVIYQRGGAGGTASGGDINARGDDGGIAMYSVAGNCLSGKGGLSLYLGSAPPVGGGSGNGIDGDTGGGGSGANANTTTTVYTGGKGGDGIVIIWEYA